MGRSARRAYLDAGARDGLATGDVVQLRRDGRAAATCRVEHVADSFATCTGEGVLAGDVLDAGGPEGRPPPPPRAALPTAQELERRRAALERAPVARVPDRAGAALPGPRRLRGSASLSHATWAAPASADGTFHVERADVRLAGAELGAGWRLRADLSALRWTARPEGARYRPDRNTQFRVREAAVEHDDAGAWAFAAGRVRPRGAAGLSVLDGAAAGWRSPRGALEAGVYGGALPDPVTLWLSSAYTGGAWVALQRDAGGAAGSRLRDETRVAVLSLPGEAPRLEAQTAASARFGEKLDLRADVRANLAGGPGLALTAARLDVRARPLPSLRLAAGARYSDEEDPLLVRLAGAAYVAHGAHADLSASWEPTSALSLSVTGGTAHDLDTGLGRTFAGPELSLPRLAGGRAPLSLGYLEEIGWIAGRSAYAQSAFDVARRVRVLGRLSWSQEALGAGWYNEAALWLATRARVLEWLSVQASGAARVGVSGGATPAWLVFSLGLEGRL